MIAGGDDKLAKCMAHLDKFVPLCQLTAARRGAAAGTLRSF